MADNSKLIIGYTIKSDKKIDDLQVSGLSRFLKINGKMLGSISGSGTVTINEVDFSPIDTTILVMLSLEMI